MQVFMAKLVFIGIISLLRRMTIILLVQKSTINVIGWWGEGNGAIVMFIVNTA